MPNREWTSYDCNGHIMGNAEVIKFQYLVCLKMSIPIQKYIIVNGFHMIVMGTLWAILKSVPKIVLL